MVKQIVGVDENGNNLSYDAALHKLDCNGKKLNTAETKCVSQSSVLFACGRAMQSQVERMDSEIRTVGNIDAVVSQMCWKPFDYAALGHIHKPMKVGSEVVSLLRNAFGLLSQ